MFKLRWVFYTEGLSFHGDSIESQSLGGSESALWYMSHELANHGHDVTVYANCDPGRYGRVEYKQRQSFPAMAPIGEWDVFVAHRFEHSHYLTGRSRLNWSWLHDMPNNPDELFRNGTGLAMWKCDQLVCLSAFHRKAYERLDPLLKDFIWQSRNGVDTDRCRMIEGQTKRKGLMVYGSRPERGLWRLLTEIWPKLLEWRPDLELVVAGYDTTGWNHLPQMRRFYADCERAISESPHVTSLGNLKKRQWWDLLAEAELVLYPTQFPEISCILAMEAMSAQCPIITSHDFALTETIPYEGVKFPDSGDYVERFIDRTKQVLEDQILYKSLQKQGRKWVVDKYRWGPIAMEWEKQAYEQFDLRRAENTAKIFDQLVYQGDLVAARDLAQHMVEQ